ncbi:MAG: FAD-dependent oxidoreductase [Bacillota bacterium]|nr:FAD-dependent oxidoreductase [Bacillota bacterium]
MVYDKLMQPIRIGKMRVKNRMVFPPMNTNYSNENGAPMELMMDYYARRARGGAGLVIVESTTIDATSRNHGAQSQLSNTASIPLWSKVVDKVHRYGAKVAIELTHFGADGTVSSGGLEPSPSNVTSRGAEFEVHEMTIEEIHAMQQMYVEAVVNAKKAGFDAITYHAAHGNIMPEFFSTLYNKRTDWYGGSFENRVRFAREIVEMTREAVGPDYPLMMRISGDEYIQGGRTLEETVEICKVMEKAGIDCFDVSGGIQATYLFTIAPYNLPGLHGFMMPSAKAIKEAVNVPVIGVGGIRDPELAEKYLEEGYADMIAIGRSFIADPDFGVKAMEGRSCDIRPCLTCGNCFMEICNDRILTCTVNPEAGREDDFKGVEEAKDKKKVLVIGGGASGLEAARISAMRGHAVTLLEKNDHLGGAMAAAGIPPHKEKIGQLVDWYEKTLKDLGVEVKKNCEYEKGMSKGFDVVFSAVGAEYLRVIPGSDKPSVIDAVDALKHPEKVGNRVVVIGGGATGCETAEFFGAQGQEIYLHRMKNFSGDLDMTVTENSGFQNKDVTIVEMMPEMGIGMDGFSRKILLETLEINGVKMMTDTKVWEIEDKNVRVVDKKSGDIVDLPADTVILAGGLRSKEVIVETDGAQVYTIGDADAPGRIVQALFRAHCVAREI